ncbi:hypothetical protein [Lutibacter sp.]|uniref:hypothetical protein n=1 Tax=Lutibacter sp. TaxID=1925666 RepID=UPI00273583B3|nr:hypothetical protein [Lutibacter sp.]MDP3312253.1 hypothetical protein [Lutibacter sp.]
MIKKVILGITLFTTIVGFSQKNNTSAYSFFGIGDRNNMTSVEQMSMGGIGASYFSEYQLNFSNPAANANLDFTTYSLALENKNIWAKDETDSQRGSATFLSYLAMGIPLGEKGGLTFGLSPNSIVGYSLVTKGIDTNNDPIDATLYSGEGGSNKVFFGAGYQLFKNFNIGIQGGYIFGKIENNIINQQEGASLATKYQTTANLTGFDLNVGFQYKALLNNKINLYLGGNFELQNELELKGNEYLYSVSLESFESPRDTILNTKSSGILTSPLKSSLGLGIGKENKWFAGIDYSYQKALQIDGDIFNSYSKISYDDYNKISFGGYYTPKFNSITNYWERVTYRAGMKFEQTGLLVDASGNRTDFTAINDFGISFGVGLPIGKQLSNINVGFELGKRGEATKGLVQENYFNFKLGLSLNDKWFKKLEIF